MALYPFCDLSRSHEVSQGLRNLSCVASIQASLGTHPLVAMARRDQTATALFLAMYQSRQVRCAAACLARPPQMIGELIEQNGQALRVGGPCKTAGGPSTRQAAVTAWHLHSSQKRDALVKRIA